jgi:hypothetical protein
MALRVGQGFTLKGSGALSGTQNYTFEGSQIMEQLLQNSVRADQLLLTEIHILQQWMPLHL